MSTKTLSDNALLIHVRISVWEPARKDGKITEETCKQQGADSDAGLWKTFFVPKKDLAPILSAANKARNVANRWTLPWMDGAVRIVPLTRFEPCRKAIQEAIAYFDAEVDTFLRDRYPSIAADAERRLGKLLKNKRMPTPQDAKRHFGIRLEVLPVPRAGDFRVGDEATKQQITTSLNSMSQRMTSSIWDQLTQLTEKIQKTMADPEKKFKNSLITNLKEFCQLLPQLNLTEDSELSEVSQLAAQQLSCLDPDDLRENGSIRKSTAKKAADVLKRIRSRKIDLTLE